MKNVISIARLGSCNLTPFDFFLWSNVNETVYANDPQTVDNLKKNIIETIIGMEWQIYKKNILLPLIHRMSLTRNCVSLLNRNFCFNCFLFQFHQKYLIFYSNLCVLPKMNLLLGHPFRKCPLSCYTYPPVKRLYKCKILSIIIKVNKTRNHVKLVEKNYFLTKDKTQN